MSDKLIAEIVEGSRIFVPRQSLGLKAFSIDCLIELDGTKRGLTLGRPFAGVDDRLWGVLGEPKQNLSSDNDVVELEISRLSLKSRKLLSNHAEINGLSSIDELTLIGPDERSLRFFGDIDDFEVPCINCELAEG